MRQETKHIKKIIQNHFPGNSFKFLYREGYRSGRASDRIVISGVEAENEEKLMAVLRENTEHIHIYRKGTSVRVTDNVVPRIKADKDEWVESDCMEYIEISVKQKD